MGDMADDAEADWYAAGCPEFDEDDEPMFTPKQMDELREINRRHLGRPYDAGRMSADGDPEGYGDPDVGKLDWRATDPVNAFMSSLRSEGLDLEPYPLVEDYVRSRFSLARPAMGRQSVHRKALVRACPKCKASPGERCVYTQDNQIHKGPRGEVVWNQIGAPMLITHLERRRPPQTGESETVSSSPMNKRAAEAMAAVAGEALARYAELEAKYGKEPSPGSVIRFSRSWSNDPTGRVFEYAVLRTTDAGQLWYTTGPKSPKAYTWEDLMNWMDLDQGVQDLFIVKALGWQPYPKEK